MAAYAAKTWSKNLNCYHQDIQNYSETTGYLRRIALELVVQKVEAGETDRGPWHTVDLTDLKKKKFPRPTDPT